MALGTWLHEKFRYVMLPLQTLHVPYSKLTLPCVVCQVSPISCVNAPAASAIREHFTAMEDATWRRWRATVWMWAAATRPGRKADAICSSASTSRPVSRLPEPSWDPSGTDAFARAFLQARAVRKDASEFPGQWLSTQQLTFFKWSPPTHSLIWHILHSFWHSIRHSIWHFIILYHTLSHIFSDMLLSTFHRAFHLTFFVVYVRVCACPAAFGARDRVRLGGWRDLAGETGATQSWISGLNPLGQTSMGGNPEIMNANDPRAQNCVYCMTVYLICVCVRAISFPHGPWPHPIQLQVVLCFKMPWCKSSVLPGPSQRI